MVYFSSLPSLFVLPHSGPSSVAFPYPFLSIITHHIMGHIMLIMYPHPNLSLHFHNYCGCLRCLPRALIWTTAVGKRNDGDIWTPLLSNLTHRWSFSNQFKKLPPACTYVLVSLFTPGRVPHDAHARKKHTYVPSHVNKEWPPLFSCNSGFQVAKKKEKSEWKGKEVLLLSSPASASPGL